MIPGNNPQTFRLEFTDQWVTWNSFYKGGQAKIVTEVSPHYKIVKEKGHRRVKLIGYSHIVELL